MDTQNYLTLTTLLFLILSPLFSTYNIFHIYHWIEFFSQNFYLKFKIHAQEKMKNILTLSLCA